MRIHILSQITPEIVSSISTSTVNICIPINYTYLVFIVTSCQIIPYKTIIDDIVNDLFTITFITNKNTDI